MAALVQDIAQSVRGVLLDPSPGVTWADTLLLEWFNDVLAAASNIKRDINPQVVSIPLVAGTVQTLPATALQILEPYFNTASKNACTKCDQTILSRRLPAWRTATATTDATDIMLDERVPLQFFCYPPNNASGAITALCGVIPIISSPTYPLITCTVPLPVPDNYRFAIESGIISRALGANTRRQDIQKSAFFWQQFENGIKTGQMTQPVTAPIDTAKEVV